MREAGFPVGRSVAEECRYRGAKRQRPGHEGAVVPGPASNRANRNPSSFTLFQK